MTAPNSCPFCTLPPERILLTNAVGWVIRDGFPVSPGHTLIIPKRHVGSFFDLVQAQADIAAEFLPAGYNVGINDGAAAGQTVPHLHIHLIPRFQGDVPDPRGGVRWVIPHKARYW